MKKEFIFLLTFSVYCSLLVAFRMYYFNSTRYAFMVWNLFLAWVPLFFSLIIQKCYKNKVNKFILFAFGFLWLIFFPNAPYIVTDFVHLRAETTVSLLYDILMIFSFAWLGIILGVTSLRNIENILTKAKTENGTFVILNISGGK